MPSYRSINSNAKACGVKRENSRETEEKCELWLRKDEKSYSEDCEQK